MGVIGTGLIADFAHLPAYREAGATVVAVADVVESRAARMANKYDVAQVYTDYRRLLERKDIEAVSVCVPNYLHAPIVLDALAAGKHVLVEKPMACTMDEARAMVEAAERRGVTLMVAQVQRYQPSYRGVRRLCASGELGAIRAVRFDSMQNAPAFLAHDHWLFDGSLAGGGIVISVSVHRIDLVRFLIGGIRRVQAITHVGAAPYSNGAEDYAAALLEFENGAIGEHFATYSGFRMPYSESFMIFGDDGAVHALPQSGQSAGSAFFASRRHDDAVARRAGWEDQFTGFMPVPPDAEGLAAGEDGFANEIAHFASCCRSGATPVSSGRDNLGTMRAMLGIYRSAERGGWVRLADV